MPINICNHYLAQITGFKLNLTKLMCHSNILFRRVCFKTRLLQKYCILKKDLLGHGKNPKFWFFFFKYITTDIDRSLQSIKSPWLNCILPKKNPSCARVFGDSLQFPGVNHGLSAKNCRQEATGSHVNRLCSNFMWMTGPGNSVHPGSIIHR